MKEVAKLLKDLKASGVIRDYALFGAVAQMRYEEGLKKLAARHKLTAQWAVFQKRFIDV